MSRVDTSTGKGGGQLTENPAKPDRDGGHQPQSGQPAPRSGEGQAGVQPADSKNKQQG